MRVYVRHRRIVASIAALCLLAQGESASAKIRYTMSVRQLVDQADVIVRVRPLDAEWYIVDEVLRGPAFLEDVGFRVDTREYEVVPHSGEPIIAAQALLFLRHSEEDGFDYEPLSSGIRLWTRVGEVLTPFERGYQPWGFRPEPGVDWHTLLENLRRRLLIRAVLNGALSTIDPDSQWVELLPPGPHGSLELRISPSSG